MAAGKPTFDTRQSMLVAVDTSESRNWFVRDADRRWLVTFPFGLVHGCGFAGALTETSLPPRRRFADVGMKAASAAITLAGFVWFAARLT